MGRLLPFRDGLRACPSWDVARALAVWGSRWSFDPGQLGERQRASLCRRTERYLEEACPGCDGQGHGDVPHGGVLHEGSPVFLPWVWHEASDETERRRVGSAWLLAGDSRAAAQLVGGAAASGCLAHPDALWLRQDAVVERLRMLSMSCNMNAVSSWEPAALARSFVWFPPFFPRADEGAFLGSIVWALRFGAPHEASRPSGWEGPDGREREGPHALVGGWPAIGPPQREGSGQAQERLEFLNRREWAIACMGYASLMASLEGAA